MSYTKQNFTTGQVLKASHLNYMESGISDNADAIATNTANIATLNSNLDTVASNLNSTNTTLSALESSMDAKLDKKLNLSGGTVTGIAKFDNQPQVKYGSGYYSIPFNKGNNSISFLWKTTGLEIYIDTTMIGVLPNGFSNTNFKVNGMFFGDDIYVYNNGSGQLYCRTGTNGNYSYKQLAP